MVGLVVGFLIVGAASCVSRGSSCRSVAARRGGCRADPPPAVFDVDEAFDWVVQHVPDVVAATLTPDDVRRILGFQLEYFQRKGVSVNGSTPHPRAPVVVGGAETIDYILERAAATGEAVPARAGPRGRRDPADLPPGDRCGRRRRPDPTTPRPRAGRPNFPRSMLDPRDIHVSPGKGGGPSHA